jgi:hypothetical protein
VKALLLTHVAPVDSVAPTSGDATSTGVHKADLANVSRVAERWNTIDELGSHAELRADLDHLIEGHAVMLFVMKGIAIEVVAGRVHGMAVRAGRGGVADC